MSRRLQRLLRVGLVVLGLAGATSTAVLGLRMGESAVELAQVAVYVVAGTIGVLITRAQPRNPIGWLLLAAASAPAAADASAYLARLGAPGGQWLAWGTASTRTAAVIVLLVLVPLRFPDGLVPGPRWRWVERGVVAFLAVSVAIAAVRPGPLQRTDVSNPLGWGALDPVTGLLDGLVLSGSLAALLAAVASVVVRYRQVGRSQRGQIKWLAYAVVLWLALVLIAFPVEVLWPEGFPAIELALVATGVAIPASVGVAVLRHNLYDIDLVISRTLVYATLTVAVIGLYVVTVGYLSAVIQTRGNVGVSLIATGIVAVAFSPLRERLQRAANRLVYGDRDNPTTAIARLGRRLDEAAGPQDLLACAATEVAEALRLRYVAIEVATAAGAQTAVRHGTQPPSGRLARVALHSHGTTEGWLVFAPRSDEELSPAERRLLDILVRPIGATVQAHRLAEELRSSRERLVAAREDERSRLHRDLHDGLGPQLATLSMLGEAAHDTVRADARHAELLLQDLVDHAQRAVADLREVVHGLRPAALDLLGLAGALRTHAASQQHAGFAVEVDAVEPDPPLPAAIEVAAYRIVLEAITNAVRHADASRCVVRLFTLPGLLRLEVIDDGRGMPPDVVPGMGLLSMRSRAAELGGECTVTSLAEGGTVVSVTLPLPDHHDHDLEASPTLTAASET